MSRTAAQQAAWDAIPNGAPLTPALARASGWTQDAQGRWVGPGGARHWSGQLPQSKESLGGMALDSAKDFGTSLGIASGVGALASAAAPAAASAAASGGTTMASGWSSWLPKIQELLPVGIDIARGVNANKGINDATQQQQAATDQAMRVGGDVYAQQRADAQNLFGQPYQTLGGLMGFNIAPIGPPMGTVPTTAAPTGRPPGLQPNTPIQTWPGMPVTPSDLHPAPIQAATLGELRRLGSKSKSASGYAKARA